MSVPLEVYNLGNAPYRPTWDLQAAIQQRLIEEKRAAGKSGKLRKPRSGDVLLFVEHPHVYTLGKSGDDAHLLRSNAELLKLNAEYVEIDRGGDITYHGPGQIVGYPIMDLDRHFTDIHKFLRYLEEVIIRTCAEYDIEAGRIEGLTGVWVDDSKICAMGIKCSRWVTMHGFALNVNTQLDYFGHIVPCGISDKKVTSLEELLGRNVDLQEVREHIVRHFSEVFDVSPTDTASLPEFQGEFSYFEDYQNIGTDTSD